MGNMTGKFQYIHSDLSFVVMKMEKIIIYFTDEDFGICQCGKRACSQAHIPIKYKDNYRVMNKCGGYNYTEILGENISNGRMIKTMCYSCAWSLINSGIAEEPPEEPFTEENEIAFREYIDKRKKERIEWGKSLPSFKGVY